MTGHLDANHLMGTTAYADDGDKIGEVDTVYVDDDSKEPKFVLVNTGLFGMRSSFVPLEGASLDGDALRLPYSKDKVQDAPNMEADGDLAPDEEQELFRYYGMDVSQTAMTDQPTGAPTGTPEHDTPGRDTEGRDTDDAMTRSEEELHVGTTQHETGRVRLRKHVTTEHVTKTVPVQREEVRVEREPITASNRDAATDGPELTEDEHEVVLHEEEPVVEKRTVPKERVQLDKETHTDQEQVEEDVAREEIDITDPEDARNHGR